MGARDKLRRLEKATRGHLKSFELSDGSRYYYDPMDAELFLHICECLHHHDEPERPEPPEIVKALTRAKDRRAALAEMGHDEGTSFGTFPYEVEPLIERGELVPRSLVVGYELGEPLPDLSE